MILHIFFLLLFPIIALSEQQTFFVKIAMDNVSYMSFSVGSSAEVQETSKKFQYLIQKIKEPLFDINAVKKEYYNVQMKHQTSVSNAKENIFVYEITPSFYDRFSHLIWVSDNKTVLRREVYDVNNKLLYAYGNTDAPTIFFRSRYDRLKNNPFLKLINVSNKPSIADSKGFELKLKDKLQDGSMHYLYSDGLNKFSLFIRNLPKEAKDIKEDRRIVIGNYVLTKEIERKLYTVVGTIPFDEMEKLIDNIHAKGGNL